MLKADSTGSYVNISNNVWGVFLQSTEKRLLDNYAVAMKSIRAELLSLYSKHGTNGALTYSEMARYNRLKGVFNFCAGEIKTMTGKNRFLTNKLVGEAYNESYYRHAFAFDKYTGYELSFGLVNPKTIEAMIENPLKKLAEKNLNSDILQKIRTNLTQALIRGDSFVKVADSLKSTFEMSLNRATRIVRTEGMRAFSQGQIDSIQDAEDQGIVGVKQWMATLDLRTRDSHGYMDGKKADDKGYFHLHGGIKTLAPHMSGYAGEDINCRCRTIYIIGDYVPSTRRVKGEGVIAYKNYDEWKQEKIAA